MTARDSAGEVAYGFAMLGVIGFLWALVGGATVALAVRWPKTRVATFVPPLLWVFAAWAVLDFATAQLPQAATERLSWWDTDWLGVLTALVAIAAYRLTRRAAEPSSLMLWMALGWWAGFLMLVVALGWHMTPPRSDNWAGSVGMGLALVAWLYRRNEHAVLRAALVTGCAGAVGFTVGQFVANTGRAFVPDLNWWSVMEQTFGFIAGAGLLIAVRQVLATAGPPPAPTGDETPAWTDGVAVGFLLLAVPWLNVRKNPQTIWLRNEVVPERMGPFAIGTWFLLAFLLVALVVVLAIREHLRHGLDFIPTSPRGRAQMLFLGVLWVMVLGNLSRYLPFPEGRLVTEGVIHVNAAIVSGMAILSASRRDAAYLIRARRGLPDPGETRAT